MDLDPMAVIAAQNAEIKLITRERDEALDKYRRKSRSLDLCEENYERVEAENELLRSLLAEVVKAPIQRVSNELHNRIIAALRGGEE